MEKPKIRFKGYQEDWEQRKLGDVFEQTSNLVNPKEDEIELWSLTVEDGLTKKSDRYNREFLVKKDDNFKEVRPGDIVYNPMNMTLGAVGYNGMAKSVAVSGYYTTMVAKENYDTYYINTWLKSPQAIRLYRTYATGSLIEKQRVQFPTLSIIPVTFPKYEEQIKIGSYFHSLDNLITLHQRKCEEMKTLKKYMLQKMFPQNGQSVPQIRFSGFTEDWEQRKLSDVVDSVDTGKSRFDKEGSSGEYPILGSTSVIGYDDEYDYEGDFILTARVGANAGSLYRHAGKVKISDNTVFIQASQNIEFLYQLLIQFDIKKLSFGTGQPLVKASELKSLELMMPSDMKEQMRIGVYFKNLDSLITLHQQKCDELRNIKKFMLQNMFI